MFTTAFTAATALLLFLQTIAALEVAPNSQCAPQCIDDPNASLSDPVASSTQPTDVICEDWELDGYNSTSRGRKWNECVTCESTSNSHGATRGDESDTYWFLYNMKVTIILCVFEYPATNRNDTAAANTCANVCGGSNNWMKKALMDQTTTINNDLQYNYCSSNNSAFTTNYQACSNCLERVPAAQTMVNYLRALNDACTQKPSAGTGEQVKLDFPLFPNGTSAAPSSPLASATSTPTGTTTSAVGTGAASTSAALPSAVEKSNDTSVKNVGLGVGLGLGLPLLAALAGLLFLLWKRQAHRRKDKEETARRIAWEEELRAKVIAEVQELYGGTKMPPEMMATALVEADSGPPAVPEKDSGLLASPNDTSPTKSPISLNDMSTIKSPTSARGDYTL